MLIALVGLAGMLGSIGSAYLTNRSARQMEAHRLHNERELKVAELEEGRLVKLRDERAHAYATLNRLASTFDPNEDKLTDLTQTLSHIQLLTRDEQLLNAAEDLVGRVHKARSLVQQLKKANPEQDPAQVPEVQHAFEETEACRKKFVSHVQRVLGIKPQEESRELPLVAAPELPRKVEPQPDAECAQGGSAPRRS